VSVLDPRAVGLSRRRIAIHEAAHASAAALMGRPVTGAFVNGNGGGTTVGLVKPDTPTTLEATLDDIVLLLIGDVADPSVEGRYYLTDDNADSDESRALSVAMRCASTALEARAVVQLGRARAQALSERSDFIALASRFAAELMEHDLDAETINEIRKDVTHGTRQAEA
jgi:hypothetical protein